MTLMLQADASLKRRQRVEKLWRGILLTCAMVSIAALIVLMVRMFMDGASALSWEFFTERYLPRGARRGEGGIFDSIMASVFVLVIALVFAVPIGTAGGIYLHEYAKPSRLTNAIRTTVSNLAGVPSVVYGLLGLAVFVRLFSDIFGTPRTGTFLAAGLTLGVLILPILIVATEEALKTVPNAMRHASLGLGATKWQTVRNHVLPYALPGILTGQILALSRAAGETAPLLIIGIPTFTTVLNYGVLDSGAPLQVRAYFMAKDADADVIGMAAGSIVVLLLATLLLNAGAIWLRDRLQRKIRW